ncbi:SGNH/GDSL hydrolase family protein, partial [Streptomyces sp. NPDC059374]
MCGREREESKVRRRRWSYAVVLALFTVLVPGLPAHAATARGPGPLPLERLFDNTAVSDDTRPAEADFDGSGASLSAQDLAAAGWTPGRALTVQGTRLTWPGRGGAPDNVRAAGQEVRLRGRGDALAFLVAGTAGTEVSGTGAVTYADGTRSAYALTAPDWRTGPLATKAVALAHLNTPGGPLAERP